MVKKMKKYAKFVVCMALIAGLVAPSYAALSASDGSAFVTKAEFDSALADFNARLTTFEAGINSKIDSQVTSYLDRNGIWNGLEQTNWFNGVAKHVGQYGFFLNGWTGAQTAAAFNAINVPSGLTDELRLDLISKRFDGFMDSLQIGNTITPGALNYLDPAHGSFNHRDIVALVPFYNEYTSSAIGGSISNNQKGVKWNTETLRWETDPSVVDETPATYGSGYNALTSFKLTLPLFTPNKSGLAFLKGKFSIVVPTDFSLSGHYVRESGRNQLWIGPMADDTTTAWMGDYDGTYPPDKGFVPIIESAWCPPNFKVAYDATNGWGYGSNQDVAYGYADSAFMAVYPSITLNITGNLFVKKDEPITIYMSWQRSWDKATYNKKESEGGYKPEQKFYLALTEVYNNHYAAMPKAVVY